MNLENQDWEIKEVVTEEGNRIGIVSKDDQRYVAFIPPVHDDADAIANLIKEAPKMLQTLKDIKSALIDSGFFPDNNILLLGIQEQIDSASRSL